MQRTDRDALDACLFEVWRNGQRRESAVHVTRTPRMDLNTLPPPLLLLCPFLLDPSIPPALGPPHLSAEIILPSSPIPSL